MAGEIRCGEFMGAMRVSIPRTCLFSRVYGAAHDSRVAPSPTSTPPLWSLDSGQLHVRPLPSRRHSSAGTKWLQVQQSASTESTKPVRAGNDDAVFRTETDGWSTMFEIEGAVKELCEEIIVERTTTLKP